MPDEILSLQVRDQLSKECAALAKIGTLPTFIPPDFLSADDWAAFSEDDRAAAAYTYRTEIMTSLAVSKLTFPVIKTPQGGILYFQLPDGTLETKLQGVILAHFPARGWWKSEEMTNSLPDCSSVDGIHPASGRGPTSALQTLGAKTCAECPYDAYESDSKGRGKACKERINVFFLRPGSAVPWKYAIPPTGLKVWDAYVTSLVDGRQPKPLASVVTEFGLQKAKGGGGHDYAQITLKAERVLKYADMRGYIAVRDRFYDNMRKVGTEVVDAEEPKPVAPAGGPVIDHDDGAPLRSDSDAPPDLHRL